MEGATARGSCTARLAVLSSQLRPPRAPCAGPLLPHEAVAEAAHPPPPRLVACPETIYDPKMLKDMDEGAFLRDGYICLPGIMTEECRRLWSASLRRWQQSIRWPC